jgi:hypothetical protein
MMDELDQVITSDGKGCAFQTAATTTQIFDG